MIRHETLVSTIRFYLSDKPSEYEDYCAICTLVWESPTVVKLIGLNGEVKIKHWYALIELLQSLNVKILKANRSPKHKLPFVNKQDGTACEILVEDLVQKYLSRKDKHKNKEV